MSALYNGGSVVSKIYWFSAGSPDFTGTLSGYPTANLSNIIISSQATVGPDIPENPVVPTSQAGGDLVGFYPNPGVAGMTVTTATGASAGSTSSLPSKPVGFVIINVNGVPFKIPYYGL